MAEEKIRGKHIPGSQYDSMAELAKHSMFYGKRLHELSRKDLLVALYKLGQKSTFSNIE